MHHHSFFPFKHSQNSCASQLSIHFQINMVSLFILVYFSGGLFMLSCICVNIDQAYIWVVKSSPVTRSQTPSPLPAAPLYQTMLFTRIMSSETHECLSYILGAFHTKRPSTNNRMYTTRIRACIKSTFKSTAFLTRKKRIIMCVYGEKVLLKYWRVGTLSLCNVSWGNMSNAGGFFGEEIFCECDGLCYYSIAYNRMLVV